MPNQPRRGPAPHLQGYGPDGQSFQRQVQQQPYNMAPPTPNFQNDGYRAQQPNYGHSPQ